MLPGGKMLSVFFAHALDLRRRIRSGQRPWIYLVRCLQQPGQCALGGESCEGEHVLPEEVFVQVLRLSVQNDQNEDEGNCKD